MSEWVNEYDLTKDKDTRVRCSEANVDEVF